MSAAGGSGRWIDVGSGVRTGSGAGTDVLREQTLAPAILAILITLRGKKIEQLWRPLCSRFALLIVDQWTWIPACFARVQAEACGLCQ